MKTVLSLSDARERAAYPSGYTASEVSRLLSIPPAQIRAFVREAFITPRSGPTGEDRFSFQDLVLLRTAKSLTGTLSSRKVRRALRSLKEQLPQGRSLSGLRITAEGDNVVVHDGGAAWDPESGQTLLNFEVSEIVTVAAPLVRQQAEEARESESELGGEDWYDLGCELETCGDIAEARDAYRRTLELDPHHPDAHVNLGRLLHEAGQLEAAEKHYRLALEARPRDATAAFDLGVSLQDLGRRQAAIAAYRRAVENDPTYADAHFNLAQLYEETDQGERAIRHLGIYRRLSAEREAE